MKAIVYHKHGSPDVLKCEEIEKPTLTDDEVLIRILIKVRAASVNPATGSSRGTPYYVRIMAELPKPKVTGVGINSRVRLKRLGKPYRLNEVP